MRLAAAAGDISRRRYQARQHLSPDVVPGQPPRPRTVHLCVLVHPRDPIQTFQVSALPAKKSSIKMMWWSVWCFAVVACGARVSCAPAASGLAPIDWREVDEDMYAVAPVGGRVAAPWVYYLGEEPHDSQLVEHYGRARPKRKMPSLSISNPMEVLRQRLMLEVARKQMRQASEQQAFKNRVFLQNVGKRGFWADSDRVPSHYDD